MQLASRARPSDPMLAVLLAMIEEEHQLNIEHAAVFKQP
jgi:hypothetical protein